MADTGDRGVGERDSLSPSAEGLNPSTEGTEDSTEGLSPSAEGTSPSTEGRNPSVESLGPSVAGVGDSTAGSRDSGVGNGPATAPGEARLDDGSGPQAGPVHAAGPAIAGTAKGRRILAGKFIGVASMCVETDSIPFAGRGEAYS